MEVEIKNFLGIQKSNITPNKDACTACENLDVRGNSGSLITRMGYDRKYDAPTDSRGKLSGQSDLNFCNFYVPDNDGQEITVLVQKGTLAAETALTLGAPSPTTLNMVLVWIRGYWNGSAWTDAWQLLNRCVYTKIQSVGTSSNKHKLVLDFADSTLKTDGLNKWSVINLTKSPKQIAKVINTYPQESPTAHQVCIEITKNQHDWVAGDSILICKNYIPYDYLVGMYSCSAADVVFHKILNDLRIGFGGQVNRLGLSIGYRKKYFRVNKFDFGSLDAEVAAFSAIDEIILDSYNCFGTDAQIQLLPVTDAANKLPTNTYYFKLVARLDNYEQFIVAENSLAILVADEKVINYNVLLNTGTMNKRITDISLYWSDDNINWWFLDVEYEISQTVAGSKELLVTKNGEFTLSELADVTEINNVTNAINPTSDSNSVSPWTAIWSADSIAAETTTPAPSHGTYCMKVTTSEAGHYSMIVGGLPAFLVAGRTYIITFKARADQEIALRYGLSGEGGQSFSTLINNTGWTAISFECKIYSNNALFFEGYIANTEWFAIDEFSVKDRYYSTRSLNSSLVEDSDKVEEITEELGYAPTLNYALSWDQAIVTKKKTFIISPYFSTGGRIVNNIFYSPFSGDGESQFDVITAGKFFPLDNFDGNDLLGLQVLSNMDFLGIKRNSIQWIDSETGQSKEVKYGNGALNNRGIVNFGEYIVFPGENDITMVNPLRAVDISEGTIRSDYRALTTRSSIIATREEKDNAYRFFTGNTTTKQEFILTKKGWISAKRYLYPKAFTTAKDGNVWFLGSDGHIYYDLSTDGDNGAGINYIWRSVVFDQSLMGEQIKGDVRFFIQMLWLRYKLTYPSAAFTVKLYLDKACEPSDYAVGTTYILGDVVVYGGTRWKSLQNSNTGHTPSEGAWWTAVSYYQTFNVDANYPYFSMPIAPGASCRTFQIEITGTDAFGAKVEIYSVGIEFTTIPIGLYAKIP